jgi:hypothetical protein
LEFWEELNFFFKKILNTRLFVLTEEENYRMRNGGLGGLGGEGRPAEKGRGGAFFLIKL